MRNKLFLSGLLFIVIIYALVFRSFFSNSILSFGDAPYFFRENLRELFNIPLAWDVRNNNLGAPQGLVLWLFLPTFVFGLLNQLFNLSNQVLIRLIFYFPATLLALWGSWKYLGKFSQDKTVRLLGSFLYGFNTYFLMLLDGGQIGMALSYGLFPLGILFLTNFLETPSRQNNYLSIVILFLISNSDLRVFIILFVYILSFLIIEGLLKKTFPKTFKQILNLFFLLLLTISLDLFWVIPFALNLKNGVASIGSLSSTQFINLTNSLLLFQPHFPLNEFGNLFTTPFYFAFLPILLFLGLIIQSNKKQASINYLLFGFLFCMFAFLTKGFAEPLGGFYKIAIEKLPLGVSFRDSSKFFIPLFLVASTLICFSLDILKFYIKKANYLIVMIVFFYLCLLIYPSLLGRLTGNLGFKTFPSDYQTIYQKISSSDNFYRSLWFPQKPSLGFGDWDHPALSANDLYKERPFASMIDGEYDLFYYLHNPQLNDWLSLIGVKYLFFPIDERKKTWRPQDY